MQGCVVVEVADRDDRLPGITGTQQDIGNHLGVAARAEISTRVHHEWVPMNSWAVA